MTVRCLVASVLPTAFLAAFLSLAPLSAQKRTWAVPKNAAAQFERTKTARALAPKAAAAAGFQPGFVREENPPLLLGNELDEARQFVTTPIYNLRLLPRRLAFDLRFAGGAKRHAVLLPQSNGLYATRVDIRYGRVGADGSQKIRATFKRDKRHDIARWISYPAQAKGELEITRHFGPPGVRAFESVMTFDYRVHKDREAEFRRTRIEIQEQWKLLRVIRRSDLEFRRQVDAAIRGGIQRLRKDLDPQRGYILRPRKESPSAHLYDDSAMLGRTIRALLAHGEDPEEPVLKNAIDTLRRREPNGIYSLTAAIHAIAALYEPKGERARLFADERARPAKRYPEVKDSLRLERWTRRLERRIARATGEWAFPNRVREFGYDTSHAAEATAALRAARLCQVKIAHSTWVAVAKFWLKSAHRDSNNDSADPARRWQPHRTADVGSARPISWSYDGSSPGTGYSTAKALVAMQQCRLALDRDQILASELRDAIEAGQAWLDRSFTVSACPGHHFYWTLYRTPYLANLARAMEAGGVESTAGRDWYFDGAMMLIGLQYPRAKGWGSIEDSCQGLMFFRRRITGPTTPGRQRQSSRKK